MNDKKPKSTKAGVLPVSPVVKNFSKFDTRQVKTGIENYSKEIHGKKNKVFRGVR